MTGVGELLASAVLKQVGSKLATAMWEAIAAQLKLGEDLRDLHTILANIQAVLRKVEKRSMKNAEDCIWMRELKAAAYDLEDMLMDFEYEISHNNDGSASSITTKEVSIPLKLRATMPTKLRAMKRRLETIANLRRFDFMADIISSDDQDVIRMQPTSPAIGEFIVGRIKEKTDMMELLKEDCEHSIIPIYGFGGLGKTTLVKMVFNDSTTMNDFDIRVWVYVSEIFDLEKIGRSVISQVDGQSNQFDFPSVQKRVEKILCGKRSLVVLDNIWEEDAHKLEDLRMMLKAGRRGSKIIVTTRREQIAKRMNAKLAFHLGVLPYEDCWNLFNTMAFPDATAESETEKQAIGQQIVKNCKGVPLAVKSLGYRLQNEPLPKWEETLQSDLWEEEHDPTAATRSTAVLPSLKISYYYMPYYLRQCFLYFSAFPKGFTMEKRDLIQRWIALGFVTTTRDAEEYLKEFLGMSFLEAASASASISARYLNPDGMLFKMHDLVHELARSVAIEEVVISDANLQGSSGPKMDNCRYMLFSNFKGWTPKCNDMPSKARAIHFKDCTGCKPSQNTFSETKCLRVLDFSGMQMVELPESMGNLHHLQVLHLSENACLLKLYISFLEKGKLRYLNLNGCSNLRELPETVHKLKHLLHLNLSGCTGLQKLPSQFGKLQKLSFLNLSWCSQLEMLPDSFNQLDNLEHLNLSYCCQLKQLCTLSFKRMKGLLYLNMSGCTYLEALPEFCGDNDAYPNLEILDLSDCAQLTNLSESCNRLHKLRFLDLSGCYRIQNIILFLAKFVKLEYLNLSGVVLSGFGGRKDSEASSSSAGHSSDYSGEVLSLKILHDILKNMYRLEYLSVGGVSLFSKEGVSSDLLTLPDFVVATKGIGNCSNIILLQNILDSTHSELNIRCLEVVKSAAEAERVELERRHRLSSLSLEWSSSEWYTPSEPTVKTMAVLENLKPHIALKHLTIKGYNHNVFPHWIIGIHHTLPNLVKLVLSDLVRCDHLPTLGNLCNLEELEIRNMPQLQEACLAQCKNLKRLSVVDLANGFILGFIQEGWASVRTDWNFEERNDTESGLAAELERQGYTLNDVFGGIKRQKLMSDVSISFPKLSATKEAFVTLSYLKIEYCPHLKLYPSIPTCEEYFINESNLEFITIMWPPTPILTHKMHIRRCSIDNRWWLQYANISIGELLIDGCSKPCEKQQIKRGNWMRLIHIDKTQIFQKVIIKIYENAFSTKINYEDWRLANLPGRTSIEDLEIECLRKFRRFDELRSMYHLVKLTLSCPENFLHTDKSKILMAVPHIQCIKINKGIYFAVQESDFLLLHQNKDFEITDLFISYLNKVKKANEVGPRELARYYQLRSLSLVWLNNTNSNSNEGLFRPDNWPNDTHPSFSQGLSRADDSAVLQSLQPHPTNLSTLKLEGYGGATFCAWMRNANDSLPNIVRLELIRMPKCERLPPLGHLAKLEELHILDMPNIREVDSSFYGGRHPFKKLSKLHIIDMGNLEVWSTNLEQSAGQSCDEDEQPLQGNEVFPCVKHLIIKGCPRLTTVSAFQGCIKCIVESCSKVELSPEKIAAYSHDGPVLEVEARIYGFSDNVKVLQYLIVEGYPGLMLGSAFQGRIGRIVESCSELSLSLEKCAAFSQDGSVFEVEVRIYGFSDSTKLLQYLIIQGCPRLTLGTLFLGCIRRIIESCSEVELSSKRIVGSSRFSRLQVETEIFGFSEGLELLRYSAELSNLTIDSISDLITLPEVIQNYQSLRSLQILNCWNFAVLPDWLGHLASLEELEIHAPKLQCLPHAIKSMSMTSLKKLTLKKCNYKLRERCSSSGQDYDKIKHIKNVDANEGPDFSASSSSDITLLQYTTSPQLIELNINSLEHLSTLEAKKIELAGKEELHSLSLEWSSYVRSNSEVDKIVLRPDNIILEELQPHQNLRRLCIKNYSADHFPRWMCSLQNLVRLELFSVRAGHLHLDYLPNLEDLCIVSFYLSGADSFPMHISNQYGRSPKYIVSTQILKNLKAVTVAGVGNLVWKTSTLHCIERKDDKNMEISQRLLKKTHNNIGRESHCVPTENIYPALEYLDIDTCSDFKFEPSIPRSLRYIISGSKKYRIFELPSFKQVMESSASSSPSPSKMEIRYGGMISSKPFDSFRLLNIDELTVDRSIDSIPLPKCIQSWKSLWKLEILNCENIETLPEWLGDMASLRELKVDTYWMQTLPPCIERLTSLQTLILSQCTKRLKQRCSESGDDWSKIKHIENVKVELRP